jgi:hypothetical protein
MYIPAGLKASPLLSAFSQCTLLDHRVETDVPRSLAILQLPLLLLFLGFAVDPVLECWGM